MNSSTVTISLIVLIVLAALWSSGRIEKLLSIAFGSAEVTK